MKQTYGKLSPALMDAFKKLLPGRVQDGQATLERCGSDETPRCSAHVPEAVASPHTAREVAALLRFCSAHRIPVTPRGGGTGLAGGAVPVCGGVVLSMEAMNAVLGIDEDNMLARVQAGVKLGALQADCAAKGLFYPPDPGEKDATLGGNAALNAGGMRAVKYGVTRDFIRAATVVLANGDILRLGTDCAKSSSGYALLPLFIGSEGTLGVITELTLRLLPQPKERVSLLGLFRSAESALNAAPMLRRFLPCTVEYMETALIRASADEARSLVPETAQGQRVEAALFTVFDGDDPAANAEAAGGALLESGALDVLLADTPAHTARLFSLRESLLDTVKARYPLVEEIDAAVPVTAAARYLLTARALTAEAGLTLCAFGHAADGNLHLYLCGEADTPGFAARSRALTRRIWESAAALGGVPSGEHGLGITAAGSLPVFLDPAAVQLMRQMKQLLDPLGILNPGKLF